MTSKETFEIIKQFDKTKNIKRKIIHTNKTAENDAEHSFMAALLVMTLDHLLPMQTDKYKLIQMLLIHDLVETVTGDVWFLASAEEREQKKVNEDNAAKELFKKLPKFQELWEEYEERKTLEAYLAKQIDIIQAVCTIVAHNGETWRENKITQEREMAFSEWIHKSNTPLGNFLADVFKYAIEQDMFYKETSGNKT
jgi:putative hydrolase of HD superfamily